MKKAGVLVNIIKIILGLIIIALLYIYLIYPNLSGEPTPLIINKIKVNITNVSGEIKMFYPNMRFTHNNFAYSFENCDANKMQRMKQAFSEISSATGIITFAESQNADIMIGCSSDYLEKEKNVFVAGEGGPSEIYNSSWYPAILKGKILLYESECRAPVVELHELLHVFGFEHINKSDYIMYPYVNCSLHLNQEYVNILKNLYSIPPKPELYFENLSAVKKGSYLDFNAWIVNQGLVNSTDSILIISTENKEIKTFKLNEIPFGAKKNIAVQNLKLSSRNTKKIQFEIKTSEEEYSKTNNIAYASI